MPVLPVHLFEVLLNNLQEGVYYIDRDRIIQYWNDGAEQLTGYTRGEVIGSSCGLDLLGHIDAQGKNLCKTDCPLTAALHDGKARRVEVYMKHKDGYHIPIIVYTSPIRNDQNVIIGAVESFFDNSAKIEAIERIGDLEKDALLCPHTGIANRRYADRHIEGCIELMHRTETPFGFLLCDVDRFKPLNDRYGYGIGDVLLKMIANTMRNDLKEGDFIARWTGKVFAIMVAQTTASDLYLIANRQRLLVQSTVKQFTREKIGLTLSIGATLARSDDTAQSIIERADRLLTMSIGKGGNRVSIDTGGGKPHS